MLEERLAAYANFSAHKYVCELRANLIKLRIYF